MKKLLALLLALLMIFSLVACSNDESDDEDEKDEKKSDKAEKDDDDDTDDTDKEEGEEPEALITPSTFEEIVVVDNDACSITITGLDPDGSYGYEVDITAVNKTEDVKLMFSIDGATTNGVSNDPFWACSVEAGKTALETVTFSDDELADLIGDFTDIYLAFRVYDYNDYSADPVAEVTTNIYPYGQDKATVYTREPQSGDVVILENDKVMVVSIGYGKDEYLGYEAKLFLVNKTDTVVMFAANDVSVNDIMCEPYFATTVEPNSCKFDSMSWSDSTFAEKKIETVEKIDFTMRAYDNEDWFADDFADEPVTLNP